MKQEVPPGGNSVIAYFDLVAHDTVSHDAIRTAVATIRSRLGTEPLPITVTAGGIAARFGAILALEAHIANLQALLDRLLDAALGLLARRPDRQPSVTGPYVVWAFYGADGIQLSLPTMTLHRVPQSPARRVRMLIPPDILHSGTPFDILRECAAALLGLGNDDIESGSGIEIVDPRTGKTLTRYGPKVPT
jgi:hypothetical protein